MESICLEKLHPAGAAPVWEALNGLSIYIGLLNRVANARWKQKLDLALGALRARCNPILYFGWTAEALPCTWRDMRLLTDHMLLDQMLDKYVHAYHYFSPATQTMSTTGATNMI